MRPIRFSDEAKANIRGIPRHIAMNVLTAIYRLAENGAGDVKKLHDSNPPEFRLRVGDYRVRFTEAGETLYIHAVKDRKEAYR